MNEKLDPKELKILADILALVLEDEKGQSVNALEAIKKRAKKNGITGGSLKNLFYSVAQNPPKPENTSTARSRKNTNASSDDLLKARSQITTLTQDINRLDMLVRNLRMQKESLQSELLLTRQSRSEIQAALHITESKASLKTVLIIISFFCGLLIGVMSAITFNPFHSHSPSNNTIYLN